MGKEFGMQDGVARDMRRDGADHCFNFGEFGHGRS